MEFRRVLFRSVEPNSLDLVEATPTKTPLRDVTNTVSLNTRKTKLKKKNKSKATPTSADAFNEKANEIEQQELDEVTDMLQSLSSELALFEQLTGAKSALEDDDLKASLTVDHKTLPSAKIGRASCRERGCQHV